MSEESIELLAKRRFLPLFITQFLGAANDNFFKNAMALLIIYRIGAGSGSLGPVLTNIGTGLFVLPLFLFSATAGELADRFEKSRLMKMVKFTEVLVALVGGLGLVLANVPILMATLFLFGTQAAFFGPLKYALLPEHLRPEELIGGNGLIEGGTFLAILIGTIAGGLLIPMQSGPSVVSGIMLAAAVLGFSASLFLPRAHGGNPSVHVKANPMAATAEVLRTLRSSRAVFLSVMGISWFWAMGATFLTEFPAYAKNVLGADQQVVTLLLAMFSIGIGIGSVLCAKLLKGEISARHVPFAALAMAAFTFDIVLASSRLHPDPNVLSGIGGFLAKPSSWRILFDLLMLSGCGGLYTVPLYAMLQSRSNESERARVVAGNNIVNAIFMVIAAGVAAALLAIGFSVVQLFLVIGIFNLVVAIYICGLLPKDVMRGVLGLVLRLLYRVEIKGQDNLRNAGERVVIVANHVSFLDAILLGAFLPGDPVFAIDTFQARLWYVRPILAMVDAFPLDPTNPMSVRALTRRVQQGGTCVIFPEGRLTRTGALMKVYEGPGLIADRADATIVPVRLDGVQYTHFSRLKGKIRPRWFPRITLTILPPRHLEIDPELAGRKRRQHAGQALYDIMSDMMFESGNARRSLSEALLDARHIAGGQAPAIVDIQREPMSYAALIRASHVLGRVFARATESGENVGVLLPNANACVIAFMGLQAAGRVPAMLNYTTGAGNVLGACKAAQIRLVVSSRQFVERARLSGLVEAMEKEVRFLWLEEARETVTAGDKLSALFAAGAHRKRRIDPEATAMILFTSGSEGTPKGVALTHANLLSNCLQLSARIDFNAADIVFNALPLFHSFGMTGGLLLPLLNGVKTFLYPSPLHYRIVPELVYDSNATIFFGTNTFLAGYARQANPYDFSSVRYIFSGAERVEDSTRRIYAEKFGLRILEGYGATECGPVIAVNTPMHNRSGSVGRLMPGLEHRLDPVPGIEQGGRLFVRGPNVMKGYLRVESPGLVQPPEQGWHDTGDIVTLDDEGFVRIKGRAKRFAKIAGEMVSLAQVEIETAALWPESQHAVVAVADEKKGEQLVLVTTAHEATRDALTAHFRSRGLAELLVPRTILVRDALPVLGTGKIDYPAVQSLVAEK